MAHTESKWRQNGIEILLWEGLVELGFRATLHAFCSTFKVWGSPGSPRNLNKMYFKVVLSKYKVIAVLGEILASHGVRNGVDINTFEKYPSVTLTRKFNNSALAAPILLRLAA